MYNLHEIAITCGKCHNDGYTTFNEWKLPQGELIFCQKQTLHGTAENACASQKSFFPFLQKRLFLWGKAELFQMEIPIFRVIFIQFTITKVESIFANGNIGNLKGIIL